MVDWEGLRRTSLQPAGFGSQRIHIWPTLLNARPQPAHSLPDQSHPDEHQINLDTERSFVLYPDGHSTHREQLKSELYSLLVTLFRKHPKLSYFQGYHDIVTVLFLTLPKELQFVCVEKLSLHRLRDSMCAGLEPVLGLLRVTKNLIRLADPTMASMLELSSGLPFFALPNLLTLFSHDMPTLPLIQHVFDYLLCRPPVAVVYLAAAIILSRKDQVKRLQDEDEDGMIHSLLSSLPPLTDDPEPPQPTDTTTTINQLRNGNKCRNGDLGSLRGTTPIASDNNDTNNDDDDTTIIALSPSPGRDPDTDTDVDTDSTPFSPPPESDLTLVDTTLDPNDPSNEDSNNNSNWVTATPTKQRKSPSFPVPEEANGTTTTTTESEVTPSPPPLTSRSQVYEHELDEHETPASHSLRLSSLLTQADTLYALYPPSHPSLLLSSIMGPQSVVHTWSEDFKEWPDDAMAEAMVTRPELVVYPYVESPPSSSSSHDEDSDYNDARKYSHSGTKKRHKLKKSYRPNKYHKGKGKKVGKGTKPPNMERKTMVAGAVLVLGVAMAVYGIKNNKNVPGLGALKSAGRHWPWSS